MVYATEQSILAESSRRAVTTDGVTHGNQSAHWRRTRRKIEAAGCQNECNVVATTFDRAVLLGADTSKLEIQRVQVLLFVLSCAKNIKRRQTTHLLHVFSL
jgi:hypothetical protein